MKQGGVSRYSVQKFLSQSTEIFVGEHFSFLQIFVVSKNFMAKRWGRKQGGVSRYSVKNVLSHSTEKLRRGTFLCFTKFLISEKIMDKRGEDGKSITG